MYGVWLVVLVEDVEADEAAAGNINGACSSTARTGSPCRPGLRGRDVRGAARGPGRRGFNVRRWSDATRGPGPYFGGLENLANFCAPARLRLLRTWRLEGETFQCRAPKRPDQ